MQVTKPEPTISGSERILNTATQLFAELGYDAVSMSAVAEKAGVSKANIFHHFNTKQDLYIAVITSACAQATSLLENLKIATSSFAERLEQFSRHHTEKIFQHQQAMRLLIRELLENNPDRTPLLANTIITENFERLVDIVRNGQKAGQFRQDIDPALLATLIIGSDVFFFLANDALNCFPSVSFAKDLQRYTTMIVDVLLNGALTKDFSVDPNGRGCSP